MTDRQMQKKIESASAAARQLATLSMPQKKRALDRFANLVWLARADLLRANKKDLYRAEKTLSSSMLARLKLDEAKIKTLRDGIREVAKATNPVHRVIDRM